MTTPEPNAKLATKIRSQYPNLPGHAADAAARGMVTLFNYGRGLAGLADNLLDNEVVKAISQCDIPQRGRSAQGVVTLTDRRIIASGWIPGLIGKAVLDVIDIEDVTNMNLSTGLMNSELVIQVPGGDVRVSKLPKDRAAWFVESYRTLQAVGPSSTAQAGSRSDGSATERMKELTALYEQGMVSNEEYQAKRQSILDQL